MLFLRIKVSEEDKMKRVKNKWIFAACFCLSVTFLSGSTNSKFGSFYPFVSVETDIFTSKNEYEIWERTIARIALTHWNMMAGGVQYQKSVFFSSLSYVVLWKANELPFRPAFDVNLGINLKNVYIYGGKNFSVSKNSFPKYRELLTNPIYAGGKYIFPIKNKNIGFEIGTQISRGKLNAPKKEVCFVYVKETYFSYALNSRISYKAKDWLYPYIFLSVKKYDLRWPWDTRPNLSVNIGVGAFIGKSNRMSGIKPPVQKTSFLSICL